MLREFKRILKPGGLLIISSPDKRYYSDLPGCQNQYHVKELYEDEFKELIRLHFENLNLYGQKVTGGSLVFSKDERRAEFSIFRGDFDDLTEVNALSGAPYLICRYRHPFFDGELIEEARRQGQVLVNDMRNALSFRVGPHANSPASMVS